MKAFHSTATLTDHKPKVIERLRGSSFTETEGMGGDPLFFQKRDVVELKKNTL